MNVLAISITEAGRRLAERLPYEHVHGAMAATVRTSWRTGNVDAFVLFASAGVAVRIVGPLLGNKRTDPAVVTVDEAGRYVVSLAGGHDGGANDLTRTVAQTLGAHAVVTTATDAAGLVALDTLPGFVAEGDLAGVTAAMLDGRTPTVENLLEWPLPAALARGELDSAAPDTLDIALPAGLRVEPPSGPERILISDLTTTPGGPGVVVLRPPSLVVGVGTSTDAPGDEVAELVRGSLAEARLSPSSVTELATIDRRRDHPAITGLGLPVTTFPADDLASVDTPNPSTAARDAVGTPSVCEAAALLAAGPGSILVVEKQISAAATVAVARRARPAGRLTLVGLGPGDPIHRTPAAEQAIRRSDVVIGYSAYVDQCADLLSSRHQVIRSPLGSEVDRAHRALELAAGGRAVAMVCSGDAGVYAMASPVFESARKADFADVDVKVVPGITAGLATAAVLGAPLGHDHVLISLSDLLTPWEQIERRINAAADSDLVVVLYNPRSERRIWQLDKAMGILAAWRAPGTPIGIVTDAGRANESAVTTTIAAFDSTLVTMTSCVVVGSSTTVIINGRMVTPRGYGQ